MPSALSAENPCFLTELARLADSIRDARSSLLRLIDLKVERGAHPALFLRFRAIRRIAWGYYSLCA